MAKQPPTLLTPAQLSARWEQNVKVKTLANWRSMGRGPRFRRLGSRILYPLDEVIAYEKANSFSSTQEYDEVFD